MARPVNNLEVWAKDNLNLPVTGKPNKQRPIDDLWSKGYDRGQKPAAEEHNYVLNLLSAWLKYILDEGLPSYLPINGTSAQLSGDLSGTINWNGSSVGTGNIQVIDNSHNHVSANITDATEGAVPNTVVKRANNGSYWAGRSIIGLANDRQNFDYFMTDDTGHIQASVNYSQVSDLVQMYLGYADGNEPRSKIVLKPGLTEITNPRTLTGQEGQPNSLVRFDYLRGEIDSVNNRITQVGQQVSNSAVMGVRLSGRTYFTTDGMFVCPTGCVLTALGDFGAADGYGQYSAIQTLVNNNWFTISGP